LAWTVGGQLATLQVIPYLAKELLGDLIRVSSGVKSESEIFSGDSASKKLSAKLAGGNAQALTPAYAGLNGQNPGGDRISEICDMVDDAVDCELKRLYGQAAALTPHSSLAAPTRTQISNLERFRSKMLSAFEEYTSSL
jgi:hypothetical protein